MRSPSGRTLALWMLPVAACGGASGSVTGLSSRYPIVAAGDALRPPADEVGFFYSVDAGSSPISIAAAAITSVKGSCALAQQGALLLDSDSSARLPDWTVLEVAVLSRTQALTPGTFPIGDAKDKSPTRASVVHAIVQNGRVAVNREAERGTVTLTMATPARVSGSFDVTFSGGEHVTGDFSAPVCSADWPSVMARHRPRDRCEGDACW
jgi:hypothetical protein